MVRFAGSNLRGCYTIGPGIVTPGGVDLTFATHLAESSILTFATVSAEMGHECPLSR
jgi:hypothetical protein